MEMPGVSLWLCPKKNTSTHETLTALMASLQTLFPGSPPSFEPHITITSNLKVDIHDPEKSRDAVDRILSASAVAFNSLPKDGSRLVTLGKVDSQRKYFKKLYFKAVRNPDLISLARIIRELFVILPNDIEEERSKKNPHLYVTDSNGNKIEKKPIKRHKNDPPPRENDFDRVPIQRQATVKAAEWAVDEYDPHLSLTYSDLYPIDNALWRTIKTRVQDYLNIDNCDSENMQDNGLGWNGGVLKLVLCEGPVNEWITLGSVDLH